MILFCIGTRPEAIKCAPLIKAFRAASYEVHVCVTGQHDDLLWDVLQFFEIEADTVLPVDVSGARSMGEFTGKALAAFDEVLARVKPQMVMVQGDTVSTFLGAYGAYLRRIPIAHIEAGLRSYNLDHPFPEEMNRRLVSQLATLHFTPTEKATDALSQEGINHHVYQVGNSAIDALFLSLKSISLGDGNHAENPVCQVMVTLHRREHVGEPLKQVCDAITQLLDESPDMTVRWPLHPNPQIGPVVREYMTNHPRLSLEQPLSYPDMIQAMRASTLILTDSGGIQEEAPSLDVPVLVLRDTTERTEGLESGVAKIVGTDQEAIVSEVQKLLSDQEAYQAMTQAQNPYGDGQTSQRIVEAVTDAIDRDTL